MADGLTIDGPSRQLDVFECPHCKETIDVSADVCRFCGAKVDHEAAAKAAELLATVDQACSDASYLRNTAAIGLTLAGGAFYTILRAGSRHSGIIDQFGFQNILLGFSVLVMVVASPFPFWSLRWWSKYAKLTSDDDEFQSARATVRSTGLAATVAFAAAGVISCLVLVSKAASR
jgi:hypothetical protein